MTNETVDTQPEPTSDTSLQTRVTALLLEARKRQRANVDSNQDVVSILEEAVGLARATPFEVEFQTRIDLAMALGDVYVSLEDLEKARRFLNEEADFAETVFQVMQASGTTDQKRAAAGGRVHIRDRARQVSILHSPAPEIDVKNWINGEPTTLEDLRGRVVLLEFWATWCKPCQAMFPKLKQLDEDNREAGLEVIALTRHYFAGRDTSSSQADELELMRSVVKQYDLGFRVGVSEDERTQSSYGATGMPTLALIDRAGSVRYAHFGGGDDARFTAILADCLSRTTPDE